MSYKDKNYNYGYCGRQYEVKKEARNFYLTIGTCFLLALSYVGCKQINDKLPDDFRAKNTNTLEVKVR